MQETLLNYQPSNLRNLYQEGRAALNEGDFDRAITVFNQVLGTEPGFVECRESLRQAQLLRAHKNHGFLKHAVEEVREIPELVEAETYQHSQPLKAIHAAEQVLNHVPTSILAHKILAQAALKADMPRTALLSLDFIRGHAPEEVNLTLELADALAEDGQISKALSVCGRLLKDNPDDRRVNRAIGRLSKLAFNAHTDEMSKAAAARYFRRLQAPKSGLGNSTWLSRSGAMTNSHEIFARSK